MRRVTAKVVVGLLVTGGACSSAFAVDWVGSQSDDWFNPANWSPAGVPSFASVMIDTTSPNATRISGSASGTAQPSSLTLGANGNGELVIENSGKLQHFGLGSIGESDGNAGEVTVDGPGSRWDIDNAALYVGNDGDGDLDIEAGGVVDVSSSVVIARLVGSSGDVRVHGSGSTLASGFGITVGGGGPGTLTVEDGATVTNTFQSTVGSSSSGVAVIDGAGSRWGMNRNLFVGQSQRGELMIRNGGGVSISSYLRAGINPTGEGLITVTGESSRLDIGDDLGLGQSSFGFTDGEATLTITDGALVKVDNELGVNPDGQSALRLDGGFLAVFGDVVTLIDDLVAAGLVEIASGTGWADAGAADIDAQFFNDAVAAETFTGGRYGDLGGFTVVTSVTASLGLAGDFNDSGSVEQGDLNLVLNHWGQPRTFQPNGDAFATQLVDQEELNRVLNNWGASAAPSFAGSGIPEPANGYC